MRYTALFILLHLFGNLSAQVNYSKRYDYIIPLTVTGTESGSDPVQLEKSFLESSKKFRAAFKDSRKDARDQFKKDLKDGIAFDKAKSDKREAVDNYYKQASINYSTAVFYELTDGHAWFPARNQFTSRFYYNQNPDKVLTAVSNNYFTLNTVTTSGSLYSELVASSIAMGRLSLGAMLAKSELKEISGDDIVGLSVLQIDSLLTATDSVNASRQTVQNILGGGGNFILNFSIPVYQYSNDNETILITAAIFNRVGFSVPKIGTVESVSGTSYQGGAQIDGWLNLGKYDKRNFALNVRATISSFTNKAFAEALGLTDTSNFVLGDLAVSLDIVDRFRLGVSIPAILTEGVNKDQFKPLINATINPF